MSVHILHVSDLHTGTHEDPEVEEALAQMVERVNPELIVASGDLLLEEGDEINAIVAPEAISEFAQRFGSATPTARMTA